MGKETCTKFSDILISFHQVMRSHGFEVSVSDVKLTMCEYFTLGFLCLFNQFLEKETSTKFYGVFNHILQTYEAMKF